MYYNCMYLLWTLSLKSETVSESRDKRPAVQCAQLQEVCLETWMIALSEVERTLYTCTIMYMYGHGRQDLCVLTNFS